MVVIMEKINDAIKIILIKDKAMTKIVKAKVPLLPRKIERDAKNQEILQFFIVLNIKV